MITRSKQTWEAGRTVKVGFLSLTVKAVVPTPGDYLPDAYILSNLAGTQLYRFVPHNGLEKIDGNEAARMLREAEAHAAKIADKAIKDISTRGAIDALFHHGKSPEPL